MANVSFSKALIDRAVGKSVPVDEMEVVLASMAVPMESCENEVVTVDVTANRPDLLSGSAIARYYAKYVGKGAGLSEYEVKKSQYVVRLSPSVKVVRPFTACAVVTGMAFDEDLIKQLIQLQEKLHVTVCRKRAKAAIGVYPMERIAWPITYEARKPIDIRFRPLDARGEMPAKLILEQNLTGKEYAHLLKDALVYPVFVDGKGAVLSMPPIINSFDTGRVTSATKDVFVECSGFDFVFLNRLLSVIVTFLAELGGSIHAVTVQDDKKRVTPDFSPQEMKFDVSYVNKRLGTSVKESELKALLGKVGVGCKDGVALFPVSRFDVMHQIDVVEEIAIAVGYSNLTPQIPNISTIGEESPFARFQKKVSDVLVGAGMLEVATFHLSNRRVDGELMGTATVPVALVNALTEDFCVLRSWLLPSVVQVLQVNTSHEFPQMLFGFGRVFAHDKSTETGVAESERLALVVSHARADLTEIKQCVEYLARLLGVSISVAAVDHPSCIPGRSADVLLDGKRIGFFGELSPQVLTNFALQMPCAVAELDMDALFDVVRRTV